MGKKRKIYERKIVDELVADVDFYDVLDGKTPEQVMLDLEEQYPDLHVYYKVECTEHDGIELSLYVRRLETDAEYESRVKQELGFRHERTNQTTC